VSEAAGGSVRVGLGIDVHARDTARRLFLGGVLFEGAPGLAGHSDGDPVCHAVAEALLGATGQGDLGMHFPDTDPAFEGIAGLDLLARTVLILREAGFVPRQCDLTVIAEHPAISPHREEIRRNLATTLGVAPAMVSVKATRPEGLGLAGDGAGCLAVATVGPVESA
jgi:2-C-methyl-D-erythritol 2,4-cyclodiphosphate synthase